MAIAEFSKLGVVGSGQMGAGIAQVAAMAGLPVTLVDVQSAQIEKAKAGIFDSLTKMAAKGRIEQSVVDSCRKNLSFHTELTSLKDCDLVIEAIVENEGIKAELFKNLDKLLAPHAILASNTSSIPITRLGAYTKRPTQFVGMHFMNPVPVMKLVEIIPSLATAPEVTRRIEALAKGLGKDTIISQDYPGFVVNRVLMPMINEAFQALMNGVASAEDIDKGMKLGTNQPMGPLALADFIGLDTCHAILNVLHDGLGDPRYHPSPLLSKYVEAGWLGKKTGRGVFTY